MKGGGYVGSSDYEKVIQRSWMDLHGGRRTRPSGLAGRIDDLFYGPFDEVYEEFVRDRGFPRLPKRQETVAEGREQGRRSAGWRVAKTKEVTMSDRVTIKALCKKHGWIFAEEDAPDDPRWRGGSRIYFPGSSVQPTTSSSEND